jgi:hypothetical protein
VCAGVLVEVEKNVHPLDDRVYLVSSLRPFRLAPVEHNAMLHLPRSSALSTTKSKHIAPRPHTHLVVQPAPLRVAQHHFDLLVYRLEVAPRAGERAARAGAGDEGVQAPVRLPPDLRAGGREVRGVVRAVLVG